MSTFEENKAFFQGLQKNFLYTSPKDGFTGKVTGVTSDGHLIFDVDPSVGLDGGHIWFTAINGRTSVSALNKISKAVSGVPCVAGFNSSNELVVYDIRVTEEAVSQLGGDLAPLAVAQHTISTANEPFRSDLLTGGRVLPSSTPGLTVYLEAYVPAGFLYGLDVDVSADIPATANQRLWELFFLDSSGVPQKQALTAHTFSTNAGLSLMEAVSAALALPAGSYPLAAVSLSNGETAINLSTSRFQDLRGLIGKIGVSITDATPTATGFVLIDQSPTSGHPIALTEARLGAEHGIVPLSGDVELASAYLPTPSGTIDEKGRWVKSASNPILIATDTWENTAVCEPCVLFEDGLFKMWYRGGWGTQGIGYATCPQGSDPTGPANWTKSVSNPIIGQGGSGVSGNTAQPSVIHVGSLYYLYYTEFGGSGDMKLATSADGVTAWTIHSGVVMAKISGMTSWGNRYVWREDVTWYMLSEGNDAGGIWHIYLASSTDGLTFTLLNSGNPLTSLVIGSGGGVSGPWMPTPQQIQGLYELWYHAANTGSPLPTNLYRATSPDKINWTIITPNPVLALSGSGFEIDQVADPKPLEVDGISYLFYDGDDNVGSTAAIGVASIACTLHELVNSVGAPIRDDGTGVIPFDELPLATSSTPGIVQPDNTTITISGGVISSVGGGGGDVYAPLVTGDLPGPTPIATVDGQFIMAPTT